VSYPKSMYKGTYTPSEILADHRIVRTEKEERVARKEGYKDGHEFFYKPPIVESE